MQQHDGWIMPSHTAAAAAAAAVVSIFFVGVAIYLPSLGGKFVFDDSRAIEENANSNFR